MSAPLACDVGDHPVRRDRLAGARKPGNDRLLSDMEGPSYSREGKSFDLARARRILDARKVERIRKFLDAYGITLWFRDSSWTAIPAPAILEQEVGTYPRRAVDTPRRICAISTAPNERLWNTCLGDTPEPNMPGPLLIIAGAGTGKTKTLAHRVAHLILRGTGRNESCC